MFIDPRIISCGHTFCNSCLLGLNSCPLCRQLVVYSQCAFNYPLQKELESKSHLLPEENTFLVSPRPIRDIIPLREEISFPPETDLATLSLEEVARSARVSVKQAISLYRLLHDFRYHCQEISNRLLLNLVCWLHLVCKHLVQEHYNFPLGQSDSSTSLAKLFHRQFAELESFLYSKEKKRSVFLTNNVSPCNYGKKVTMVSINLVICPVCQVDTMEGQLPTMVFYDIVKELMIRHLVHQMVFHCSDVPDQKLRQWLGWVLNVASTPSLQKYICNSYLQVSSDSLVRERLSTLCSKCS